MKQILSNFFENVFKNKTLNDQQRQMLVDFFVGDAQEQLKELPFVEFSPSELTFLAEHLLASDDQRFLENFLRYHLFFENYDAIIFLFSKIFVSHVGKTSYASKNSSTYDNLQKTFDRFVEACTWTNLTFQDCKQIFLVALKSPENSLIAKWKVPAKDFLIDWVVRDEKEFYDFLFNNFSDFGMVVFSMLLDSKIPSAVPKLVDFWLNNTFDEQRQVKNILKSHFDEIQKYVQELEKTKEISTQNLVKILLIFPENDDAKNKLVSIFEKEKNNEIKKLILEELEILLPQKNVNLAQAKKNSQRQELQTAKFFGLSPQNFPKLVFKNGEVATNEFVAYYLQSYKNLLSPKASSELGFFREILEEKSMDNFSLFVASKILNTEGEDWAFCLLENCTQNGVVLVMKKLAKGKSKNSNALSKFLKIFVPQNKAKAESIFCGLDRTDFEEKHLQDELLKAMIESKVFSSNEIEGFKDRVVPKFCIDQNGICKVFDFELKVNENYEVEIKNSFVDLPKNVQIEQKRLQREIQRQSKRLEKAFHNARMWTEQDFEQFVVSNNLLCFLSQNLLWGRYNEGNLVSVFCLNGTSRQNILSIESKNDCMIGLFHPVELDDYDLKTMFARGKNAPFNQLFVQVNKISSYNPHSSFVPKFNGFLVNFAEFFAKIKQFGWKLCLPTIDGVVFKLQKSNEDLGLIAEMGFSPVSLANLNVNVVMGELRFYSVRDVIKTGNNFVVSKPNSLELIAVPPRYFSDILFELNISTKK